MSRLQVGGLALVVGSGYGRPEYNIGKVVSLLEYHESLEFDDGAVYNNCWSVTSHNIQFSDGEYGDWVVIESKNLMPLGDKKTQDELMKEKELQCN